MPGAARFPLGVRLVEAAGVRRCRLQLNDPPLEKFCTDYARNIHPKKPSRNDVWHLDEVVITIVGKKHRLRRVVDHDGYVLDKIVGTAATPRRRAPPSNAGRRKWTSRGSEQPRRELTWATAKALAYDAELSIAGKSSALPLNLLRHPKSHVPTQSTTLRFQNAAFTAMQAIAEWKTVRAVT